MCLNLGPRSGFRKRTGRILMFYFTCQVGSHTSSMIVAVKT